MSPADPEPQIDQAFREELSRRCGLRVQSDPHTRGLYSTDASIYQVAPLGVVVPESIGQIPELLRVCSDHGIAVLPRGGGTSLAGQCVNQALVVDVSAHCDALLGVDPGNLACSVEAGITIDDLNDRVRSSDLFFAPDPSTARQANIGGCIGNNAAGVHSVLYGRTSENVLSITACLIDGQRLTFARGAAAHCPLVAKITGQVIEVVRQNAEHIRSRFPKTMRRSSGYQLDVILEDLEAHGWDPTKINLAPLLCGSEGTLACTLEASLRLHPIPKHKGLAVLSFSSVEEAIGAVPKSLELGPSGVELLDDLIMDLARKNTQTARYVSVLPDSDARAVLLVEFFADQEETLRQRLSQLKEALPGVPMHQYTDPGEMVNAWNLRKAGEPLLHGIKGNRKPLGFVEDNAIPVANLSEFVRRFRAIVEDEGTIASYYAHASVGVLHVRPLLDLRDPTDEAAMHRIAARVADLTIELGGVPSGEHGDGRARGPFIEQCFGPELLNAFREIKSIFDPRGLLNPGIIVNPKNVESISSNTRIRPNLSLAQVPEVQTFYQYVPEQGFAHAVELCNGAGVCRRKSGGVMCPSYQAARDERHSTRGRGNALRLAITGQCDLQPEPSGRAKFDDNETLETLDLCLSCKGCKSECPSSVDIAKLKSEYLAQGYQQAGVPARVRVMSRIHLLNRIGSIVPSLSNSLQRFGPVRSVLDHSMGMHPARSLPEFARPIRRREPPRGSRPKVMVLCDTFSTHNEPFITQACVEVLERFGYGVGVHPVSDLGRAAISLGNLEYAIRLAQKELDRLEPMIRDESVLAFLLPEPSCLSVVLDDWPDLALNRDPELIELLRKKSALPETFLEARWDDHPEHPRVRECTGSIIFHGHCHQKSLWGSASSTAIIDRLFPGSVRELDTGCCGMAGSFGYAAHRFELSMKIGEQSLFPAVRALNEQDVLIAPGTSCRHQIRDGTGKVAIHPIQAISKLLRD